MLVATNTTVDENTFVSAGVTGSGTGPGLSGYFRNIKYVIDTKKLPFQPFRGYLDSLFIALAFTRPTHWGEVPTISPISALINSGRSLVSSRIFRLRLFNGWMLQV